MLRPSRGVPWHPCSAPSLFADATKVMMMRTKEGVAIHHMCYCEFFVLFLYYGEVACNKAGTRVSY
eukprot:1981429-Rhodomonas_salina.1